MSLIAQTRTGILHLHFGVRHGQTALLQDLQKAPLMVIRPFRLPCGTLMVYIVNPTGGLLGGDHNEIRVQVEAGAQVLLLTQAATRVQPSPTGAAATQDIQFTVAAGARLEYYPERTIPFKGSHFHQTFCAELEGGAEFGWLETFSTGRVLSGERLLFEEYVSLGQVWAGGKRVYLERQWLRPGPASRAPGVLGNADYFASGVWVAPRAEAGLELGDVAWGCTETGAIWYKDASVSGIQLDSRVGQTRDRLRRQLFEAGPLIIRH